MRASRLSLLPLKLVASPAVIQHGLSLRPCWTAVLQLHTQMQQPAYLPRRRLPQAEHPDANVLHVQLGIRQDLYSCDLLGLVQQCICEL